MNDRVSTSAVFTNLRRSNGEVYLLKGVADALLELIKSDERIIAEQQRIILDLKTSFEKFASDVTLQRRAAASQPNGSPVPGSDSSGAHGED
jgi:hypothetical protein